MPSVTFFFCVCVDEEYFYLLLFIQNFAVTMLHRKTHWERSLVCVMQ